MCIVPDIGVIQIWEPCRPEIVVLIFPCLGNNTPLPQRAGHIEKQSIQKGNKNSKEQSNSREGNKKKFLSLLLGRRAAVTLVTYPIGQQCHIFHPLQNV